METLDDRCVQDLVELEIADHGFWDERIHYYGDGGGGGFVGG